MRGAPPGWPSDLRAPGSDEWIEEATKWLLDLLPGEYRAHAVLRKYPVLLARLALASIQGSLEPARTAWSRVRVEEKLFMPPPAIEEAIAMLEREGAHFVSREREVTLVLEALERALLLPGA